LKTAALPPGIFWIQHCCEKLAFGNSIVLRTRRSTLGGFTSDAGRLP
jgi:hypothetical protein